MRPPAAAALLALLVLLSGCAAEPRDAPTDEAPEGDGGGEGPRTQVADEPAPVPRDEPAPADVPDDVVFTGSLKGVGVGLVAVPGLPACALGEAQCAQHVVTVPGGPWNVTFRLVGTDGLVTSQGIPGGTDYDLTIEGVGASAQPSGQADVVRGRLKAGDYAANVVAWHDLDGSYTLTVSFAP